jgi:dinuclear metal center YbgI/SA1388 family protein
MKVNQVFAFLEGIAPFGYQESYDNSGFLIGSGDAEVTKICLCLDITRDVVAEAKEKNANLIISHHPVIFKPLSGIKTNTPVHELIKNDISAICAHTNFDVAVMSDLMLELLGFPKDGEILEVIKPDGAGFGKAVDLSEAVSADELAKRCKTAFKSASVRYYDSGKAIRRVGVCSGSGGDVIDFAADKNCDALITGEAKYSEVIKAQNIGLTLIEAGHYYTECILCDYFERELNGQYTETPVFIAENSRDFCKYI